MAKELFTAAPTGLQLDAYVYSPANDTIWNTSTLAFETPIVGNWANYIIPLTETAGSYYADFPTAITSVGTFPYVVRIRQGVSAADSDGVYASGAVIWDGSDEDVPTGQFITTRSYIKIQNGWTDTTYDARIDQLLPALTAGINKYLRRVVVSDDFTETRSGQGTDWIRVWNPPVNSVTSITFEYNGFSPTTITGSNFVFDQDDNGGLIKFKVTALNKQSFSEGFQNIQIVYNGGYTVVPYNIQAAAALVTRKLLEMSDDERLVTEKVEGNRKIRYDQAYAAMAGGQFDGIIFGEAKALLQPYILVRCH